MNHVNPNAFCVLSVTYTWHLPGSTSCHILPAADRLVEQTNIQTNKQTDMLPDRVVHFTDGDAIKIYDPFIQF